MASMNILHKFVPHACLKCSSLWVSSGRYFCDPCYLQFYREFERQLLVERSLSETIRVYSPILWVQQRWMSEVFHAQKLWEDSKFTTILAEKVLQRRGGGSEGTLIIPAPPRQPEARDHAHRWAQALALLGGGEVVLALSREGQGSQKQRGKVERKDIRMALRTSSETLKMKKIVFVDDVVTTGSTALAAYSALGAPRHFEVWAMGCRPKGLLL